MPFSKQPCFPLGGKAVSRPFSVRRGLPHARSPDPLLTRLVGMRGGEKALESLCRLFPQTISEHAAAFDAEFSERTIKAYY
ncbi:MAG: hypothetical protein LBD42_07720 [Desulfovibrio sp.]|nr:hypothetical protein [Desulfovibrio sp.]